MPGNVRAVVRLYVLVTLAIASMFALSYCAHPPAPPPVLLWEICRDACAQKSQAAAAVVGSVDPLQRPACMCAPKKDPT